MLNAYSAIEARKDHDMNGKAEDWQQFYRKPGEPAIRAGDVLRGMNKGGDRQWGAIWARVKDSILVKTESDGSHVYCVLLGENVEGGISTQTDNIGGMALENNPDAHRFAIDFRPEGWQFFQVALVRRPGEDVDVLRRPRVEFAADDACFSAAQQQAVAA